MSCYWSIMQDRHNAATSTAVNKGSKMASFIKAANRAKYGHAVSQLLACTLEWYKAEQHVHKVQVMPDGDPGSDLMTPFDRSQPSSKHSLTK